MIIFDIFTAIFFGAVAGWVGVTKFAAGLGAGIVGGLIAIGLCYVAITLGFRIHKALR